MSESVSEIRKRAWATRREKYGHLGHNGSYTREPGPCSACDRMRAVLVRLHVEGILSEGQIAKATGMHRIDVRKAADEYTNSAESEAV
jgi:ribosomal protein S14